MNITALIYMLPLYKYLPPVAIQLLQLSTPSCDILEKPCPKKYLETTRHSITWEFKRAEIKVPRIQRHQTPGESGSQLQNFKNCLLFIHSWKTWSTSCICRTLRSRIAEKTLQVPHCSTYRSSVSIFSPMDTLLARIRPKTSCNIKSAQIISVFVNVVYAANNSTIFVKVNKMAPSGS